MHNTQESGEHFKSCVSYNAETGQCVWLSRPLEHFRNTRVWRIWNTRFAGRVAGSISGNGYLYIRFNGKNIACHHAAWAMTHGTWPSKGVQVDHVNGIKTDNRIINLRLATFCENRQNVGKVKANTSGFKGAFRDGSRWIARIRSNRKYYYLGSFATREEASAAYIAASKEHHRQFARIE